ncbi:MAG: hypothetical protein GY832_16110 [Chloroflexi bacterium]|nr:hypothetical protein [Chloroflexota bacterium]
MLAKSKKSAIIMAVIFLSAVAIVNVSFLIVRSAMTGEPLLEFNTANKINSDQSDVFGLFFGAVLFLGVAFLAVFSFVFTVQFIYLFSDRHFSVQGAIRWAITGVTCALVVQFSLLLFPNLYVENSAWEAGAKYTLRAVFAFVNFFVSYSLAFKWLPQSESHPDHSQDGEPGQMTKLQRIAESLLAIQQQNPDAGSGFTASTCWFMICCGIFFLLLALLFATDPTDLYLILVFGVVGVEGILMGSAELPRLQGTKMAHWLTRLRNMGFLVTLLIVIGAFIHWR